MRFEEFEQEDILNLFNLITMEVDQLFFLVDNALRIQYINKAFGEYVKKDVNEIIDQEFGEALGCSNMYTDNKNCAFTSYCSTCEIRKNLHLAFSGTLKKVEFDMVREFKIAGEMLVKHLAFKIIPIELSGSDYALCIVSDRRNQDDLTMFTNPEASI
jgi:hypothetical protein